ncbi:MAG: hypothetical protein RL368_2392, partial [Pseudomonadota bacterium]
KITIPLNPGHTWQKSYEVMRKLSLLREKLGLAMLSVPARQALLRVAPNYSYGQIIRLITELDIIKRYLNIPEKVEFNASQITGKTATDNVNLLRIISAEMDLLNNTKLTPSHVFAETLRLLDDINTVVDAVGIRDTTIPPTQLPQAKPQDTYAATLEILQELYRLKTMLGLENIDVSSFKNMYTTITPDEVYSLVGFALVEIQALKAALGLKYALTPPALHYENMSPSNVLQVLGWGVRKLRLIRNLRRSEQ